MVRINDELTIPDEEIRFTASHGGGPGGQHVNKVATRVTLRFDLQHAGSLTEEQRARLMARLGRRVNRDGVLQLSSQTTRSQARNKGELLARFAGLLAAALEPDVPRKPTRPTAAARRRRLQDKKRRSQIKSRRGRVGGDED